MSCTSGRVVKNHLNRAWLIKIQGHASLDCASHLVGKISFVFSLVYDKFTVVFILLSQAEEFQLVGIMASSERYDSKLVLTID